MCESTTSWYFDAGFTYSLSMDSMQGNFSLEITAGAGTREAYPKDNGSHKLLWTPDCPVFGFYLKVIDCPVGGLRVGLYNPINGHYASICIYNDGGCKIGVSWKGDDGESSFNVGVYTPNVWDWFEIRLLTSTDTVSFWRNGGHMHSMIGGGFDFDGAYARTFSSGQTYGTGRHDCWGMFSELGYPPDCPCAIEAEFEYLIEGANIDDCVLSAHYVKSHPNPDPDTFELRVLPECGETIDFFNSVEIKKRGVTEFYGFVEEITPEVGEDGLEYLITGRCWKLIVWKKWTERFQESREVGPIDSEGNIESGFFGSVKPSELVKFIMRCPISDHPEGKVRHKIGWGIASDLWDCCANLTADCYYPEWVMLRYTGLAWQGRGGTDNLYNDDLDVNAYDSTFTDWNTNGASPYLDSNVTTNRIMGVASTGAKMGYFDFPNLAATRQNIYSVDLHVKMKGWGSESTSKTRVYLWDGTNWWNLGYLTDDPWNWVYVDFNVTQMLDTPAKVNAARIYFEIGKGGTGIPWICHARLSVYSGGAVAAGYQHQDDYFIVDLAKQYDDVAAILIECRNNPSMYARNYKIQYTTVSNCCNGDRWENYEAMREDEWLDFTPAINETSNEARDILHSWKPQDNVRCIRIKITADDVNAWEISQIYVWQSDEFKYRLLNEGD